MVTCFVALAQNRTSTSLFLKNEPTTQIAECFSESGDLYHELGHHGPAIENEYFALRMYFDKKSAIDVYSKSRLGLELKESGWYPTAEQRKKGWGGDYYHVGNTVGLGGIRLWDGDKVIPLHPVSNRYGRVVREGSVSFLEIRSNAVPYRDREVDILVRVTVYSGVRNAKVEAFVLSDQEVQFVTGLNRRDNETMIQNEGNYLSWAASPGGAAGRDVEVGAALMFRPDDIDQHLDEAGQVLLVSSPRKSFEYWISSANSTEPKLNTMEKFKELIDTSRPDALGNQDE